MVAVNGMEELTFDFDRTPPVASIQMYLLAVRDRSRIVLIDTYSAIALPFWSRDMYLRSYRIISNESDEKRLTLFHPTYIGCIRNGSRGGHLCDCVRRTIKKGLMRRVQERDRGMNQNQEKIKDLCVW